MPKLEHTHTLVRYKKRSGKTLKSYHFRCADPKCSTILDYEMALGKASKCTQCGEEFILDREQIRRVNPRCINCQETKEGKAYAAARELIHGLFENPMEILKTTAEIEERELDDLLG